MAGRRGTQIGVIWLRSPRGRLGGKPFDDGADGRSSGAGRHARAGSRARFWASPGGGVSGAFAGTGMGRAASIRGDDHQTFKRGPSALPVRRRRADDVGSHRDPQRGRR
jgi:hypothetical protein